MGLLKEFREFALKGSVVDLAVGVIIGSAFGKIVTSLVSDVLMPPLGFLISNVKFTDIRISIRDAETDTAGNVISDAVTINVGNFIQNLFDFLIIAFVIFLMVRVINRVKRFHQEETAKATVAAVQEGNNATEELLREIRDLLKKQS